MEKSKAPRPPRGTKTGSAKGQPPPGPPNVVTVPTGTGGTGGGGTKVDERVARAVGRETTKITTDHCKRSEEACVAARKAIDRAGQCLTEANVEGAREALRVARTAAQTAVDLASDATIAAGDHDLALKYAGKAEKSADAAVDAVASLERQLTDLPPADDRRETEAKSRDAPDEAPATAAPPVVAPVAPPPATPTPADEPAAAAPDVPHGEPHAPPPAAAATPDAAAVTTYAAVAAGVPAAATAAAPVQPPAGRQPARARSAVRLLQHGPPTTESPQPDHRPVQRQPPTHTTSRAVGRAPTLGGHASRARAGGSTSTPNLSQEAVNAAVTANVLSRTLAQHLRDLPSPERGPSATHTGPPTRATGPRGPTTAGVRADTTVGVRAHTGRQTATPSPPTYRELRNGFHRTATAVVTNTPAVTSEAFRTAVTAYEPCIGRFATKWVRQHPYTVVLKGKVQLNPDLTADPEHVHKEASRTAIHILEKAMSIDTQPLGSADLDGAVPTTHRLRGPALQAILDGLRDTHTSAFIVPHTGTFILTATPGTPSHHPHTTWSGNAAHVLHRLMHHVATTPDTVLEAYTARFTATTTLVSQYLRPGDEVDIAAATTRAAVDGSELSETLLGMASATVNRDRRRQIAEATAKDKEALRRADAVQYVTAAGAVTPQGVQLLQTTAAHGHPPPTHTPDPQHPPPPQVSGAGSGSGAGRRRTRWGPPMTTPPPSTTPQGPPGVTTPAHDHVTTPTPTDTVGVTTGINPATGRVRPPQKRDSGRRSRGTGKNHNSGHTTAVRRDPTQTVVVKVAATRGPTEEPAGGDTTDSPTPDPTSVPAEEDVERSAAGENTTAATAATNRTSGTHVAVPSAAPRGTGAPARTTATAPAIKKGPDATTTTVCITVDKGASRPLPDDAATLTNFARLASVLLDLALVGGAPAMFCAGTHDTDQQWAIARARVRYALIQLEATTDLWLANSSALELQRIYSDRGMTRPAANVEPSPDHLYSYPRCSTQPKHLPVAMAAMVNSPPTLTALTSAIHRAVSGDPVYRPSQVEGWARKGAAVTNSGTGPTPTLEDCCDTIVAALWNYAHPEGPRKPPLGEHAQWVDPPPRCRLPAKPEGDETWARDWIQASIPYVADWMFAWAMRVAWPPTLIHSTVWRATELRRLLSGIGDPPVQGFLDGTQDTPPVTQFDCRRDTVTTWRALDTMDRIYAALTLTAPDDLKWDDDVEYPWGHQSQRKKVEALSRAVTARLPGNVVVTAGGALVGPLHTHVPSATHGVLPLWGVIPGSGTPFLSSPAWAYRGIYVYAPLVQGGVATVYSDIRVALTDTHDVGTTRVAPPHDRGHLRAIVTGPPRQGPPLVVRNKGGRA